ncbi:MAG: gamma-glutamyltransferase [Caulobacter sp.]|nr:gamma-glutamyltransferase [Caulobacter sp.]
MIGFPSGRPFRAWPRHRFSPTLASRGMVAAAHPLTVAAGLEILQRGGNAVEAAIAAALTAAVVMPEMCGLGGDLFALVHRPGEAPLSFLGSGRSPASATIEQMRRHGDQTPGGVRMPLRGALAVGAPGLPGAVEALLARYGAGLGLADLAADAIRHAEHGFPLTPFGAAAIKMCEGFLKTDAAAAAVYLPGGSAPAPGHLLRQTDLARTLRGLVAEGLGGFYQGDLARQIADAVAGKGGALSAADLAAHTTPVESPISTTYRGLTIHQTGLPTQGLILLEALNILEQAPSQAVARNDAASVHLQAEALKRAYADRLAHARDPDFGPTPMAALLSKDFAAERFASIDPDHASEAVAPALTDGDTTYLCVVDEAGMMVSLILSVSSAFGSGVVARDTGILLNNRVGRGFSLQEGHPNLFEPGKRTVHTLNCYLLSDAAGTPIAVGGTPGGDGQPQWNLQTLVALIDGGLDVQAAVEAPRWTVWPGTDPHDLPAPYELRVETRLGEPVLNGLEALGHRLQRTGAWGGSGAAQLIVRDPQTGVMAGGSDPRVEGLALGF